jgi:hypothetical protein
MDHHLDYGLRLHTEPKYKSLYNWAINELEADGRQIGQDQIPWAWTLLFSATSCVLTNRLEISAQFSLGDESEDPPRIVTDQIIRMTLRPGIRRNGEFVDDVTFSMFGTKRAVQDFTLEVRPLEDSTEAERCNSAARGVGFRGNAGVAIGARWIRTIVRISTPRTFRCSLGRPEPCQASG